MEPLVGNAQREERRHGGLDILPQPLQPLASRLTARGYADEVVVGQFVERGDGAARLDDDAQTVRLSKKKVDDAMGILRAGKDAVVVLRHQADASLLEPLPRVLRTKLAEEAFQQAVTTGKDLAQVADVLEGVRHVAAPATRNLHLAQHATGTLHDGNLCLRTHLF